MEFLLQGVLERHEERIAAILEAHKKQMVDIITQQLTGLNDTSATADESAQKQRQQPRYTSEHSDAAVRRPSLVSYRPSILSYEVGKVTSRSPSRFRRPPIQHETVSQVCATLQRGEQDVLNWFDTSRPRGSCCEGSVCYSSIRRYVSRIYKSKWFEWCISFAILLNAVLIGVFAEMSLQNGTESVPHLYRIANVFFLTVFLTELVIRWVTEGCYFLNPSNKNFGWNLFDLVLVLSTLAEEVLEVLHAPGLNVSFVRLARVLRLMRVTRILRVLKQLKELRIMVHGVLNCGKPLLWASLLLGLLAYMYVVFCLQISSEWLRSLPNRYAVSDSDYPQAAVDFIHANFGSLRYGMYTLLKCITGGVSWEDIADPLMEISPILLAGFLLYVLFGLACLLNLITAVFLDAAYERSHGEEAQLLEHIEQKRRWIRDAKLFFHSEFTLHFGESSTQMVRDDDHEVDLAEFSQVVQAPRVRAWFEEHGLDIYFEDPKSLFELIDVDADHKLDVHEFVAGLYRLKGGASSLNLQIEIQQILKELKILDKKLTNSKSGTRDRMTLAETADNGQNSGHLVDHSGTFPSVPSLRALPEDNVGESGAALTDD